MKIARFVVAAFCVLGGVAQAQESQPSLQDVTNRTIFSADRLSAEVSKVPSRSNR